MTLLLGGILVGVLVAGLFGFERQREVYGQMIRILENDRELARNEAKVFRGLLFPVINKAEAGLGDVSTAVRPSGGKGSTGTGATSARSSLLRPRNVPYRQWFNEIRKRSNTPQQKTDALAAALEKQVQEKSHGSPS